MSMRVTLEEVTAEPWKYNEHVWMRLKEVHQPWIAEISPAQMGSMSESKKKAYAEKRRQEWAASSDCKKEWEKLVMEAFAAGKFTLRSEGLTDAAKSVVVLWKLIKEKEAKEAAFKALEAQNIAHDAVVGDMIFDLISYATVVKANAKSVVVESYNKRTYKVDRRALRWLHYSELKELADAGKTVLERKTT